MDAELKRCPLCLQMFAELVRHHPIPRTYGGAEKQDLLEICSSCHGILHRTAEELVVASRNQRTPKVFADEKWLARARPWVQIIVTAKLNVEENDIPRMRNLFLKLDGDMLVRLHKRQKDLGYRSLEKYIMDLLRKEVNKL